MIRPFLCLATVIAVFAAPSSAKETTSAAAPQEPVSMGGAYRYPVMHITPEQIRERQTALKSLPKSFLLPGFEAFPNTVNLLGNLEYDPIERDQGWCGNCFVWASTAAMEMDLATQLGIRDRLSIQFFNSCRTGDFACCGGWETDVADFYNTMGFCVPWSNENAAWGDENSDYRAGCAGYAPAVACGMIAADFRYSVLRCDTGLIPTDGLSNEEAIANIKNVLSQGSPVIFGFFLGSSADWSIFLDYWDSAGESDYIDLSLMGGKEFSAVEGAGHMVLCVGYTENAWIMLNSWSDAGGQRPNGVFGVGPIDAIDYSATLTDAGEPFPMFYWTTLDTTYGGPQELPVNGLAFLAALLLLAGAMAVRRRSLVAVPVRSMSETPTNARR